MRCQVNRLKLCLTNLQRQSANFFKLRCIFSYLCFSSDVSVFSVHPCTLTDRLHVYAKMTKSTKSKHNVLAEWQGSAATVSRCGGRFYFTVFCSLSTNPKVKELLKSVHICQSYHKNKSGTFFYGPRCSMGSIFI